MFPPNPAESSAPGLITSQSQFSDVQLVEKFTAWKQESFDQRTVWERQWCRNVNYTLNRHWIFYDSNKGQWVDKRLAKWVPRPVTPLCKEAIASVRANFAAIDYGANARPVGDDIRNIIAAGVADDYGPILHEDHRMDQVLNEFDYWLLTTGNAYMHTCVDYSRANGMLTIQYEQCLTCQTEVASNEIADAGQKCPTCQGTQFAPTRTEEKPMPKGLTIPLSPFEIAFPIIYERFELTPYVIRMRWRDKTYYENHPELYQLAKTLPFGKSPSERTMQIFKSLPFQTDSGSGPVYLSGGGGNNDSEGIVEYDVWIKPSEEFPEGQVIRYAGDQQPVVIHSEMESLPGPLPYHDAKGSPLFTFSHAAYDRVGGRALGSGLLDPVIQKQDQLNQVDSLMQMIIMRTANPIWLEPKGAEVEKFTGEPGLVVKWNPLVAGGQAKPERIPGENIPASLFQYRNILKQEFEELTGTFDILKGQKPAGVEAYAALNLLVERGQARHTNAYKERGRCYREWFKFALEIEREFGDETRTRAMMSPTKEWAFEVFKKADLSGAVDIMIEDGTMTPKTSLGERAAIEHLNQLGMLNPQDPDQVYAIFEKFGQTKLLPGIDAQVQEAWVNIEAFEKAMADPQTMQGLAMGAQQAAMVPGTPPPSPFVYRRWYNPIIHRQELVKWAVSDRGRKLFTAMPASATYVDYYLQQIDNAIMQSQMGMMDGNGQPPQPPPPSTAPNNKGGGAGMAMANSNRNAAGSGPQASGSGGDSQLQQAAGRARDLHSLQGSGGGQ